MRKILRNPILVAPLCIFGFLVFHLTLFLGYKFGPDYISNICAKIQGFSITPFFMEAGFVLFGFLCVLIINYFATKWDGDEMVYLEIVDEPTKDLPADSKAVVFTEIHEKDSTFDLTLAAIEGAIESNDKQQASELIANLSKKELESPQVSSLIDKLKA